MIWSQFWHFLQLQAFELSICNLFQINYCVLSKRAQIVDFQMDTLDFKLNLPFRLVKGVAPNQESQCVPYNHIIIQIFVISKSRMSSYVFTLVDWNQSKQNYFGKLESKCLFGISIFLKIYSFFQKPDKIVLCKIPEKSEGKCSFSITSVSVWKRKFRSQILLRLCKSL